MKKIGLVLALALAFIPFGIGENLTVRGMLPGVTVNTAAAQVPVVNSDHCQTGLKQSVAFNISSATTTSIIAPITGANIYICGYDINQAGGTGTVTFEYGTGSTCGTGTVVIAGPYTANTSAGTTTNIAHSNLGYTQMVTGTITSGVPTMIPSQRLCILSTGSIVQSGTLIFVQE